MKTEIICLGRRKDSPSHAEAIQLVENLTRRHQMKVAQITDTATLRELITAMVPAVENNGVIIVLVSEANYLRAKSTLLKAMGTRTVFHPAVLRSISSKENETVPTEVAEEHAVMPKNGVVFLSEDGFYSGFAFTENGQYVLMLPLDSVLLTPMAEKQVNRYFAKTISSGRVTRVIGLFGIGKTETENTIAGLFPDGGECGYEVRDFGGELQLVLSVKLPDEKIAEKLCDEKVEEVTQLLSRHVYGTNQSRLAELTVNSLKASGLDVAVVINPSAKTLIAKLALVPEYTAFFRFVEAGFPQEKLAANDYAAKLAEHARVHSGAEFGAAITSAYQAGGKKNVPAVLYIALADGKRVWVRKVYSKTPDNIGEILNSAAACLLELTYRKSENKLKEMLNAPLVTPQPEAEPEGTAVPVPQEETETAKEADVESEWEDEEELIEEALDASEEEPDRFFGYSHPAAQTEQEDAPYGTPFPYPIPPTGYYPYYQPQVPVSQTDYYERDYLPPEFDVSEGNGYGMQPPYPPQQQGEMPFFQQQPPPTPVQRPDYPAPRGGNRRDTATQRSRVAPEGFYGYRGPREEDYGLSEPPIAPQGFHFPEVAVPDDFYSQSPVPTPRRERQDVPSRKRKRTKR